MTNSNDRGSTIIASTSTTESITADANNSSSHNNHNNHLNSSFDDISGALAIGQVVGEAIGGGTSIPCFIQFGAASMSMNKNMNVNMNMNMGMGMGTSASSLPSLGVTNATGTG